MNDDSEGQPWQRSGGGGDIPQMCASSLICAACRQHPSTTTPTRAHPLGEGGVLDNLPQETARALAVGQPMRSRIRIGVCSIASGVKRVGRRGAAPRGPRAETGWKAPSDFRGRKGEFAGVPWSVVILLRHVGQPGQRVPQVLVELRGSAGLREGVGVIPLRRVFVKEPEGTAVEPPLRGLDVHHVPGRLPILRTGPMSVGDKRRDPRHTPPPLLCSPPASPPPAPQAPSPLSATP